MVDVFKPGTPELLVLVLLAEGDCHGYDLVQRLRSRSGGTLTAQESSVYPVLRRLADEGLISFRETLVRTKRGSARVRIVYHLESKGRARLQALLEDHRVLVEGVARLMEESGKAEAEHADRDVECGEAETPAGDIKDTGGLRRGAFGYPCPDGIG